MRRRREEWHDQQGSPLLDMALTPDEIMLREGAAWNLDRLTVSFDSS